MQCADLTLKYGIVGYPECSGHGVCINGQCICDAGWTGYSDLELERGFDCDINLKAVEILSVIAGLQALVVCMIILYCSIKENILSHKNRVKPKTFVFLTLFISNAVMTYQFFAKFMNFDTEVIGGSLGQTVSLILIGSIVASGGNAYLIIMIHFLKNYSRFFDNLTRDRINNVMDFFIYLAHYVPVIVFILLTSLIIPVHVVDPLYSDSLAVACIIVFFLSYSFTATSAMILLRIFLKEMDKYILSTSKTHNLVCTSERGVGNTGSGKISAFSATNRDIKNVHKRVQLVYNLGIPLLISSVPLNLLFASWHFLRRKVVFLFLFEVLNAAPITAIFVWSLTSFNRKSGAPQNNKIAPVLKLVVVGKSNHDEVTVPTNV